VTSLPDIGLNSLVMEGLGGVLTRINVVTKSWRCGGVCEYEWHPRANLVNPCIKYLGRKEDRSEIPCYGLPEARWQFPELLTLALLKCIPQIISWTCLNHQVHPSFQSGYPYVWMHKKMIPLQATGFRVH
jgi:hypothetical protein